MATKVEEKNSNGLVTLYATVLIFSASHCIFFIKPVNIQSIMSIVCKVSQGVNQHFNSFFVVSVYCLAFNIVTGTLFCCLKFGIGLGILWVLFETLGILEGFDFCRHSIIHVTWNLEYPPPPFLPGINVFSLINHWTKFSLRKERKNSLL